MADNEQDKEQHMMIGSATTNDVNVDETEDEEVKRNCYGRKYCSTSSSSEDDDNGNDDDDTESHESLSEESCFDKDGDDDESKDHYDGSSTSSTISTFPESDLSSDERLESCRKPQPQKFTFDLRDCEPGVTIFRPKPISFMKLKEFQEDEENDENSCSNSDTDTEADDEKEDDSSDDDFEESDCSEVECDDFDECSTFSSETHISNNDEKIVVYTTHYNSESSSDNDDKCSDEEVSTETESSSDNESEDDEKYEDESVEMSSKSSADSNIDHVDEQGLSDSPEQKCPLDDIEVTIKWEGQLNNDGDESDSDASYFVNIAMSDSATESEGSSIGVEDLEGIMEKMQNSEEMTKLFASEEDANDCDSRNMKVTNHADGTLEIVDSSSERKREISNQQNFISNKRCRMTADDTPTIQPPLFPSLTTGSLGLSDHLKVGLLKRDIVVESYHNDEVDSQLAEELLDCVSTDECNSNPIPLLTPPSSPVLLKSDENVVAICEWPCNLTVDNALTSAIQLRVLSPSSLVRLEEVGHHEEPSISPCSMKLHTLTKEFSNNTEGDTGLTPTLGTLVLWKMR